MGSINGRFVRLLVRHVALLIIAGLAIAAFSPRAYALSINVNANVSGVGQPQIGTIDVTSSGNNVKGKFTFANGYKQLDDCYDFKWVNVINKVGANSALFPNNKYPAIDPQGTSVNAGEDNQPFYYSDAEWTAGKFGSTTIRSEENYSLFTDSPFRQAPNGWTFMTYLVVQDVHVGFFPANSFCVIAGFSWSYAGGTDPNTAPGTSTVGSALTIDDNAVANINTAIGNANNNDFAGWTAMNGFSDGCELQPCPEPGSLLTLGAFCAMAIVGLRRSRSAA